VKYLLYSQGALRRRLTGCSITNFRPTSSRCMFAGLRLTVRYHWLVFRERPAGHGGQPGLLSRGVCVQDQEKSREIHSLPTKSGEEVLRFSYQAPGAPPSVVKWQVRAFVHDNDTSTRMLADTTCTSFASVLVCSTPAVSTDKQPLSFNPQPSACLLLVPHNLSIPSLSSVRHVPTINLSIIHSTCSGFDIWSSRDHAAVLSVGG